MDVPEQIEAYISGQPEPKRADLRALHGALRQMMPESRLWFLDGRNEVGKIVSNPNIGYGLQTIRYADGKTREFYQIGLSANTGGISVYIMGLEDRTYLLTRYGQAIGKASVSGYCVKFKTLTDINIEVLEQMVRDGVAATGESPRTN